MVFLGQTFIDMTFGAGGHTRRILDSSNDVRVFGLDRDPVAHKYAQELTSIYPERFTSLLGRFSELPRLLKEHNVSSGWGFRLYVQFIGSRI